MYERVTLTPSDFAASECFYRRTLATLGLDEPVRDVDGGLRWGDFALGPAGPGVTRRLHLGFSAPSRTHVDAFWRAGVDAGHRSDGAPGLRPQYDPDYYGAFLLDPDGNSAEAVHRTGMRTDGTIDHLWIRVADLPAARDRHASHPGLRQKADEPDHVQFVGIDGSGSMSLVPGPPTENVVLRFTPAT